MTAAGRPSEPELAHWAEVVERLRWAAFLLDRDLRLAWVSPDLARFLGTRNAGDLGYGMHVFEAMAREPWRGIATTESRARLWGDLGPVLVADGLTRGIEPEVAPKSMRLLLAEIQPRPFSSPVVTSFDHREAGRDADLTVSRVNVLAMPLKDDDGALIGVLAMGYMGVRPGLVSLLARGDEAMYERMAKLVEPTSQEAAIMFCDLEGSTDLSRSLPTAEYFRLIRGLWTEIDAVVARYDGIVGKHAGDGASAFFLVDDLGSASRSASAAVRTATEIHERSERILGEGSTRMRVGIHWGGSLYIGQLVPGGRLDVTALGDAVNECARIQESAAPRQTLASKSLIERLSPDDAAALGLDSEGLRFAPLARFPGATDKAIETAGTIAVVSVELSGGSLPGS